MVDVHAVLAERGTTHGEYSVHAEVTQSLKALMRATPNWPVLSDVQRETLEMTAHKIGRILSGDPNHADHWVDIAGYNQLAADRVPSKVQPQSEIDTVLKQDALDAHNKVMAQVLRRE